MITHQQGGATVGFKILFSLFLTSAIFLQSTVVFGQIPPPEEEFVEEDDYYLEEPPAPPPPPSDFGNSSGEAPQPSSPRFGGGGGGGAVKPGARVKSVRSNAPNAPGSNATPKEPMQQSAQGVKFADAQPEDITNENFPDVIDSFDYPNAEITDVVKAISKLTGKNFILDTNVRGKITIMAPTQITVAEAYKAFLSALAINGFTVVPSGKFLKIRPSNRAQQESIETYAGGYFPNTDQFITRIIKLRFISAEEITKQLRTLASKDGKMDPFSQTNSLIITDYGTNIARIQSIVDQLDVPGFEEKLEVIKILNAKSKDIADLVDQIINKESSSRRGSSTPRFRPVGQSQQTGAKGAESYSLVTPDERTNSIIVVGNQAGIDKIKDLVKKLDFPLRPEDAGSVFVYYVKHGESEQIANVLNGIASDIKAQKKEDGTSGLPGSGGLPSPINPIGGNRSSVSGGGELGNAVFGGDVKVTADKITNSLVITASRQDYEVVISILSKLDIARDQVFIKTIIMEMSAGSNFGWNVNTYQFNADSNGIGRIGFTGGGLSSVLNPAADTGFTFGIGTGDSFDLKVGSETISGVPSLLSLVNIFKTRLNGDILSTPQILAMDNEEAEIEVGQTVPFAPKNETGAGGTIVSTPQKETATIKINVTPYISPDSDKIRLKYNQVIKQLIKSQVQGSASQNLLPSTNDRNLKTVINIDSGDTVILGGLMSDSEEVSETKVPLLGDIPILGWLFKSRTSSMEKRNLVVFLTPRIIRNSTDNESVLDEKINERIEFVQRNLNGRDANGSVIDNLPRRSKLKPSPLAPGTAPADQFQEEPATETF